MLTAFVLKYSLFFAVCSAHPTEQKQPHIPASVFRTQKRLRPMSSVSDTCLMGYYEKNYAFAKSWLNNGSNGTYDNNDNVDSQLF